MSEGLTVVDNILEVFDAIGTWFASFVGSLTNIFWVYDTTSNSGSLTFLGGLAVAGLAISVVFLIIGVISNFLHFRG